MTFPDGYEVRLSNGGQVIQIPSRTPLPVRSRYRYQGRDWLVISIAFYRQQAA